MNCTHCNGTGTKYDITCADNVATHASATSVCRICGGTGQVAYRETERPYWMEPDYVPVTTLPADLGWMG